MPSAVLQTVELGAQWPTLDPFLFCAHHLDHYPAATPDRRPRASLTGRSIGQDFAGIDGWNMYHGDTVPGFPQHPHRGFETVTYVRRGWCDHADSLGARARFGQGDVQWLTAGSGIVHSEMFPLFDTEGPNTLHLFQIWLNLPASRKMVDPYFSMFWKDDVPVLEPTDGVVVTAIAGAPESPVPPPDSWASEPDADVTIWHVGIDAGASWTLPALPADRTRVLYLFEGERLRVDDTSLDANHGAVLVSDADVAIRNDGENTAEFLVLAGRPIGEPVAQYGPFVMNDRAGVEQAFRDYQTTGFGGWPWPTDDPVHDGGIERFAVHPDGRRLVP